VRGPKPPIVTTTTAIPTRHSDSLVPNACPLPANGGPRVRIQLAPAASRRRTGDLDALWGYRELRNDPALGSDPATRRPVRAPSREYEHLVVELKAPKVKRNCHRYHGPVGRRCRQSCRDRSPSRLANMKARGRRDIHRLGSSGSHLSSGSSARASQGDRGRTQRLPVHRAGAPRMRVGWHRGHWRDRWGYWHWGRCYLNW
jgi:hypothetical protein